MKDKNNITNNKNKHSSLLADILTIIICLLCSLVCVYLFQQDLNATLTRFGEEPIGIVTLKNNLVQRRFIDRLVWDRLRNDTPTYNGDLIRTADLSEAVITFEFGDVIELQPNTLVQVFADESGVKIDFARGGLNVVHASQTGLVVTSGDKRISIDPGSVLRMFTSGDGRFDLTVNEGEVFLENLFGSGEQFNIEAGSAVKYDESGRVINVPVAVPIYPASGAQILIADNSVIPFVWNRSNYTSDTELTRLEIAYDRNFRNIFYSDDISGNFYAHNLPEGMWFWRIYPAGTAPDNDIYSRLSVARTYAPEIITPDREEISYRNRNPSLRFQWTASPQAISYKVEAADNANFINPVISVQVRATTANRESYVSSALGGGNWYWRVTPVYSPQSLMSEEITSSQQVSGTGNFSIARSLNYSAPVPVSPAENAYINIEEGRRDIVFSWRRNTEALSYTIRISANSNMASPVIEHTTTGTTYRYGSQNTEITTGTWYWTVQYAGEDGSLSPVSPVRIFNAVQGELIQRLIFPPDNFTIADTFLADTRFTWRTNLNETRFQVSRTSSFSDLLIDDTVITEGYTIRSLPHGGYYWRITGLAGDQQTSSQGRRFVITDSLPPPSLSNPNSGVSSQAGNVVVRRGQPVSFNWLPVENAEYYLFKIYSGDINSVPVLETFVYDTNISIIMDDYADGEYTWTVQGLSRASMESSRRTGLSAAQQVNVRQLRPVVIVHPRDGLQYPGLSASRTPDTAEWATPETAANVMIIIARDSDFTDIAESFPVSTRTFTLPRLSEGDYFWRVRAETIEGYDISSQPATFSVLPIVRLPAPQNRMPADRHTITARDVQASREVNFSWNPVAGANGYIVTVFQGTGRQRTTVIESQPVTETAYTIEDIRLLGRGTFYWQVEAVNMLDDGFIEQRGILEENRLVVDIPAPRNVRTRDSGVLYGL